MIKEIIEIDTKNSNRRIDALCGEKFPEISRNQWKIYGKFICGGVEKPGKTKTKIGESWQVMCEKKGFESKIVVPWDYPLKIIKESKTWVAVEKPCGISVHPSSSEKTNETIVNALLFHFKSNLSQNTSRPGLVHRLDKTTSGVLLVAKTNKTHKFLQENWHEVEKTYFAIVQGVPPKKGKIEAGILRDKRDRKKMSVSKEEKSKEAITYFETLESDKKLSLLKIIIPTGRTHQIRVHLSAIGFPILGDEKYGGKKAERVFLHATCLKFPDLDNQNKFQEIKSPLPSAFKKISPLSTNE